MLLKALLGSDWHQDNTSLFLNLKFNFWRSLNDEGSTAKLTEFKKRGNYREKSLLKPSQRTGGLAIGSHERGNAVQIGKGIRGGREQRGEVYQPDQRTLGKDSQAIGDLPLEPQGNQKGVFVIYRIHDQQPERAVEGPEG